MSSDPYDNGLPTGYDILDKSQQEKGAPKIAHRAEDWIWEYWSSVITEERVLMTWSCWQKSISGQPGISVRSTNLASLGWYNELGQCSRKKKKLLKAKAYLINSHSSAIHQQQSTGWSSPSQQITPATGVQIPRTQTRQPATSDQQWVELRERDFFANPVGIASTGPSKAAVLSSGFLGSRTVLYARNCLNPVVPIDRGEPKEDYLTEPDKHISLRRFAETQTVWIPRTDEEECLSARISFNTRKSHSFLSKDLLI